MLNWSFIMFNLSNLYQLVAEGLSSGAKRPGSQDDHSHPYRAEVKDGTALLPLRHMSSMNSV
jgi:hypothetical protein